jgi:hypothetical protein
MAEELRSLSKRFKPEEIPDRSSLEKKLFEDLEGLVV